MSLLAILLMAVGIGLQTFAFIAKPGPFTGASLAFGVVLVLFMVFR